MVEVKYSGKGVVEISQVVEVMYNDKVVVGI